MRAVFAYDTQICNTLPLIPNQHYYSSGIKKFIPINGSTAMRTKILPTTSYNYSIACGDHYYPLDVMLENNKVEVERVSIKQIHNTTQKYIYVLCLRNFVNLLTEVFPGKMRVIDGNFILQKNFLIETLSSKIIEHINSKQCLLIIHDMIECNYYTPTHVHTFKALCKEADIDFRNILFLTSNTYNDVSELNIQHWPYWEAATKYASASVSLSTHHTYKQRYKILLLNSRQRQFRYYIAYKLWKNNNKTFNNINISLEKIDIDKLYNLQSYTMSRYNLPNSVNFFEKEKNNVIIIKDFLSLLPQFAKNDLAFNSPQFPGYEEYEQYTSNVHSPSPFFKHRHWNSLSHDLFASCDIQLVTETFMEPTYVNSCPHLFITEKTYKAIAMSKPFFIAGQAGTLKYLRSCGYKTFSDIWDETYDDIDDPVQRADNIIKTIIYLLNLPESQYTDIITKANIIAKHNLLHFKSRVPEKMFIDTVKTFFT